MTKMTPVLNINTKKARSTEVGYTPSTPLMIEDPSEGNTRKFRPELEEGSITPYNRLNPSDSEDDTSSEHRVDIEDAYVRKLNNSSIDAQKFPDEPLKLLFSGLFLGTGFIMTTCSLVLAHESMPDYPPLPDFFLDSISYMSWGLDYSEYLLVTCLVSAVVVILFHSHRMIILRRCCFCLGLLYMYRSMTVFVTSIPKSNPNYYCAEKYNGSLPFKEFVSRVLKIVAGGGFSFSHKQVYCGDFIFSGHTMMFVMSFLVIKEYTPKSWFILHWLSSITSITGIILLLVGRGHYTVDVVIAYILVTRLWWGYHTLANCRIMFKTKGNVLRKVWWFRIFGYFEGNVAGIVPNRYSVPLPVRWKSLIYAKCCGKDKKDDMAIV